MLTWYEGQRFGLGQEFFAEIEATIDRIVENPRQYQAIHRDIRRVVPRKFPYGVFYRIEGDSIVIMAIVHLYRVPKTWQNR